ncbi:MAG TPA: FoF1 ATP synthase subunit a [Clostridia bacterium]
MPVTILSASMPEIKAKGINIGGFTITETMISCSIVVLALIIAAVIIRVVLIPRWEKSNKVGRFQLLLEGLVNMVDDTAKELTGEDASIFAPVYFTAACFICLGTLIEMFGLRPPISDFNVTLVLGFMTYIIIQVYGIRKRKLKRFLRYLNPINIVTDSVVPFSLALRMFGSVFSGYLIMHLIYALPFPIGYPLLGNLIFTVFHAIMQSYVFIMLSLCFISEVIE